MIKLKLSLAALLTSLSYQATAQSSLVVDLNSYDISYTQTIEITNVANSSQDISFYYGKYTSSGASVATLPTTYSLASGDTETTSYNGAADESTSFTTAIFLTNDTSGDSCRITLSYDTDEDSVTDRSYSTTSCDSSFELMTTTGDTVTIEVN